MQCTYPQVSSSYLYSFGCYRVDKQTDTQTNRRRQKHPTLFATTLGNKYQDNIETHQCVCLSKTHKRSTHQLLLSNCYVTDTTPTRRQCVKTFRRFPAVHFQLVFTAAIKAQSVGMKRQRPTCIKHHPCRVQRKSSCLEVAVIIAHSKALDQMQ